VEIHSRQDKTRQDKTRQDKTRQDKTRQDKTRQDRAKSTFDTAGTTGTKNRAMNHIQPTDVDYIDSIEDLFFKSVAQQVIITDADQIVAADETNRRLEDLEIGIRKKLFELLQENEKLECNNDQDEDDIKESDNNEIADVIGTFWKSTLDLCHHIVHHASSSSCTMYDNMASCRRLPFLLLSDCLEGLPSLEDTQKFWSDYVEPVLVDTMFGDKFWCQLTETNNSKKISLPSSHLPFLKVTNQFLKRLEYSSDNAVRVEWKGRILWALSKGFSIADKSAMKSWGNFHTTNATNFESKEEFDEVLRTKMASSTNTSTTSVVGYNIYEAFWYLQNDFANPSKIQVGEFIKKLRLILAAMESATATAPGSGCEVPKTVASRTVHSKQVKYLTSSALLPSQMNDPSFRSSVLTQFLIVSSHLGAESPPLKNALASLLVRARKLLQNDHPQLHKILWESILANGREDDWRQWKKQKCLAKVFAPNFKRKKHLDLGDAVDVITKSPNKKRRSLDCPLGDDTTLDKEKTTSEGMFTSSSHNFLDRAIPKDLNEKIPTLEQHLEPYVDALDPDSGIEDEYHPKNNSLFTWRAMRLYAKHQLPLMSQCRKPADLEKITREWYRNLHGKDIPGEMPSSELSDDDDDYKKIATTVDENDDGENIIDRSDVDVEMKDDKSQEGIGDIPRTKKDTDDNDVAENNVDMDETTDVKMVIVSEKDGKQLDVTKMNNQDTNDHERKGENQLGKIKKEDPSDSTVKEESVNTKSSTSISTNIYIKDSDQQKQKSKISETTSKPKDAGKTDGDQDSNKGRKNNQGQEKPPHRENKSERRGNDGGRNSQERGRRDDGPPPRRNRNDETQQSRVGGRSGGDASYRGRQLDGSTPRGGGGGGGRYDDDYNGDSNRQKGRGERYSGDGSSGTGGRENFRGNSGGGGGGGGERGVAVGERGGGGGRDDHRSADRSGDRSRKINDNRSRGSGSGGGSRRRR
jgi:THO complex subunit 1